MKVDLHNYTILNWLNRIIFLIKLVYNTTIFLILKQRVVVAEGQGNTVGLIVFVYSDQISTIISNKIR